jgi:hypothetical protein
MVKIGRQRIDNIGMKKRRVRSKESTEGFPIYERLVFLGGAVS